MIEQGKFPYSPLAKAFEKEAKQLRKRRKLVEVIKEHGKQFVKFNELY